jgi:2-C-methyl-D-erythritol 4-phosphate cytidylyltransferase
VSLLLLIPAAGAGVRLGCAEPKALVRLADRPLICWTLGAMEGLQFARGVIAASAGNEEKFQAAVDQRFSVIAGGRTRAESVRRGVAALAPAEEDLIVIHDAARPFVTGEEVARVVERAEEVDAAIAVLPVPDTVKRLAEDRVASTLDRRELALAATPQVFRGRLLRRLIARHEEATDEAALCEREGQPVAAVTISRFGFKITYPEDLEIAEAIARGGRGAR